MILNILGREYIFVTRFNPCKIVPFRLQVVHDWVESCGDIVSMWPEDYRCHSEIPACKARIVALIGPQEFMALFMKFIASFMNPNSFYCNPDDSYQSGSRTDSDLTHRCDPASAKSRYSEVNLRASLQEIKHVKFIFIDSWCELILNHP